jgi:hypothetical protein
MSRFKSYINPTLINDNKNEQNMSIHSIPRRHITQVKTISKYYYYYYLYKH